MGSCDIITRWGGVVLEVSSPTLVAEYDLVDSLTYGK